MPRSTKKGPFVDLHLANSNWTADQIADEIGVRPVVQLGGVNRETFRPYEGPKRYRVLCTGDERRPWKGTDTIKEAGQRLGVQSLFKVFELALGAASLQMIALQRGDPSGIIAAIFQALERIHQLLRDRRTSENADNAAHADQYLQLVEGMIKTSLTTLSSLNEIHRSPDTQ